MPPRAGRAVRSSGRKCTPDPSAATPVRDGDEPAAWERDLVTTSTGSAFRCTQHLHAPPGRSSPSRCALSFEAAAGQRVTGSRSAGTGFTPGFASRLDLDHGTAIFVKAASSADGEDGWLADAYREEVRKLGGLPPGIGAPRLLWCRDVELDARRWIVLAFEHVDGAPPRRPWRPGQLRLVLDKLAAIAPALAQAPPALSLGTVCDQLLDSAAARLEQMAAFDHDEPFLREVERLSGRGEWWLVGEAVVHMDLLDHNILIDRTNEVWFVDWNWPAMGPAWVDLVCVLISARGDGVDTDALLADHPLSRHLDPEAVDCLLALLWSFWEAGRNRDMIESSPHLRNQQLWYADATQAWLRARLATRPSRSRRPPEAERPQQGLPSYP
jgi:hypothetical protein